MIRRHKRTPISKPPGGAIKDRPGGRRTRKTPGLALLVLVIESSPRHSAARPLIERVIASVDRARDGIYPGY